MRKVRIFVASSKPGLAVADQLVRLLNGQKKAVPTGNIHVLKRILEYQSDLWVKQIRASQKRLENLIAEGGCFPYPYKN